MKTITRKLIVYLPRVATTLMLTAFISGCGITQGEKTEAASPSDEKPVALSVNNNTTLSRVESPVVSEKTEPAELEDLPVLFDKPLSTDPQISSPRSIRQLSASSPVYSPVASLPEEYWKEQKCSNCHDWTKASLCRQGKFFLANDQSALLRIKHPYGGFFKRALRLWAVSDCQ